jgi:hypothetical protein
MEHNHHGHTHDHSTDNETLALLKYMAHHNAHHAEELMETVSSLSDNSALLIKEAVALLNESTEKINQAIKESEG